MGEHSFGRQMKQNGICITVLARCISDTGTLELLDCFLQTLSLVFYAFYFLKSINIYTIKGSAFRRPGHVWTGYTICLRALASLRKEVLVFVNNNV